MQRTVLSGITTFIALAMICWAADNPVVGKWACTSDDGGGTKLAWTLIVTQDGDRLAGLIRGDVAEIPLIEPKLEGNLFTFKFRINDTCTIETNLKVEGNKFEGKFACPEVSGTMKGAKQP